MGLLLTLSSPHQRPPIPTHPSLHRFYARHARAAAAHATVHAAQKVCDYTAFQSYFYTQLGQKTNFVMALQLPLAVSLTSDYNDSQVGTLLTRLEGACVCACGPACGGACGTQVGALPTRLEGACA